MGLSTNTHVYTGGDRVFPVSFALGFLNKEDVTVYVEGELDGLGDIIYRPFTWNSDNEIVVTDPITADASNPKNVVIQRTVSKSELVVDFTQEGTATRQNIQYALSQTMMAMHEFIDGRIEPLEEVYPFSAYIELIKNYIEDAALTYEEVSYQWSVHSDSILAAIASNRVFTDATQDNVTIIKTLLYDGDYFWMDGQEYLLDATATIANGAPFDGAIPFGEVYPEHWGSDPLKVQKAIDYSPNVVFKGAYVIPSKLTATHDAVNWIGRENAKFVFDSDFGAEITCTGIAEESKFRNISFVANGLKTGYPIKVKHPQNSLRDGRQVSFEGCRFIGVDFFTAGWKLPVEIETSNEPSFKSCHFTGRRDQSQANNTKAHWWGWSEGAVKIYSPNQTTPPTLINFEDCRFSYFGKCIETDGWVEGVFIRDCVAIACKYGLYEDRADNTGTVAGHPHLDVANTHFNCGAGAVYARRVFQGSINECLFYAFASVPMDYIGIDIANGNDFTISSNFIQNTAAGGFSSIGIKASAGNFHKIYDNTLVGHDQPILLTNSLGSITGCELSDNRARGTGGNPVQCVYYDGVDEFSNPSTSPAKGVLAEGKNTAIKTITSMLTTLETFLVNDLVVGERAKITLGFEFTKGGTAGDVLFALSPINGTGSVEVISGKWRREIGANKVINSVLEVVVKKTVDGTASCAIRANSANSDATIQVGGLTWVGVTV